MNIHQLMPQQQQPKPRRTSKGFWIAFSAVTVITLFLSIFIAWLLLTQDLKKATNLVSLVSSIVGIVIGPLTLFFTILEWPKKSNQAHSLYSTPQVPAVANSPGTQSTTQQSTTSPVDLPTPSVVPPQKRRTPPLLSSPSDTLRRKDDPPVSNPKEGEVAHANELPFQSGHPLRGDAPVYIERKADQDALVHLRKMDYVSLIEPRP